LLHDQCCDKKIMTINSHRCDWFSFSLRSQQPLRTACERRFYGLAEKPAAGHRGDRGLTPQARGSILKWSRSSQRVPCTPVEGKPLETFSELRNGNHSIPSRLTLLLLSLLRAADVFLDRVVDFRTYDPIHSRRAQRRGFPRACNSPGNSARTVHRSQPSTRKKHDHCNRSTHPTHS
jgi:hypothetical protein